MALKPINPQKALKASLIAAGGITLVITLALAVSHSASQAIIPKVKAHEPPVLTEFGDFQCPHCARFAFTILPEIQAELIDQGLITYEYRHYPFINQDSTKAALAAECAREQDNFMAYHYHLFDMVLTDNNMAEDKLVERATDLGMKPETFRECLSKPEIKERVNKDRALGKALKVKGTPTLFINYTPLKWSSKEDLMGKIKAEIKQ